ncbi:MAG: hypothetical protein AAGA03_16630, partial [Planctomycetota bacterium]
MTTAIDAIGRLGRWVLEASFCCIIGSALFGPLFMQASPLVQFVIPSIRLADLSAAALGWWIGFGLGLIRLWPCLSKPFGRIAHEDRDETDRPATPPEFSPILVELTLIERVKAGLMGALLGAVGGLFLSIGLCVVVTAALLCPLAPKSWQAPKHVAPASVSQDDLHHSDESPTGVAFVHPIYWPIVGY